VGMKLAMIDNEEILSEADTRAFIFLKEKGMEK